MTSGSVPRWVVGVLAELDLTSDYAPDGVSEADIDEWLMSHPATPADQVETSFLVDGSPSDRHTRRRAHRSLNAATRSLTLVNGRQDTTNFPNSDLAFGSDAA
jgi:hypothetical protein